MVKTLDDYMPEFYKKYPWVRKKLLKKIIVRGFYKIDYYMRFWAGLQLSCGRGHAICGADPREMRGFRRGGIKGRILRREAKHIFFGRYYTALSDEEFKKSFIRIDKNGKYLFRNKVFKKKYITISIRQAVCIPYTTHIFCYYFPVDVGEAWHKDEVELSNCRYIAYKDKNGKIILV